MGRKRLTEISPAPRTMKNAIVLRRAGKYHILSYPRGEAGCIPKAEVLGCPFHWATHMWGSRCFLTGDDSRNNWWVALITFGEGLAQ